MSKISFSLAQKVLLAFLMMLLPILVVFYISFQNNKKHLEQLILHDLRSLADDREGDILMFLEIYRRRIEDYASDGLVRDGLQKIMEGRKGYESSLSGYLTNEKLPRDRKITRLSVITMDGRVAASTEKELIGKDQSKEEFFLNAQKRIFFTERDKGYLGKPEMAVLAHIYSDTGKQTGMVAGFIPLSELGKVTSGEHSRELGAISWEITKGRETMELYLVNRDRLMITGSRFIKDAVLKQKVDTQPVNQCLESNQEFTGFYRDYRGEEVAGASMCFPSLKWVLLVEIDKTEVLKPVAVTARLALFTAFITVGLIVVLAVFVLRVVVGQLRRIAMAAEEIAGGNYNINIPVRTSDEIGMLSGLFNTMAHEIKERSMALKESEASLANAQRIAKIGNWDWEMVNNTLRWSDEVYRIFGVGPGEFEATYDAFLSYVHPDDRESVKKAVDGAVHSRKSYTIDHRILIKDGTEKIVREIGEVKYEESGKPVKMTGTVQDITEQKRIEEARERLSAIIEATPDFVGIAGIDGRVLYLNKAARRMLGIGDDEEISNIRISGNHPEWATRIIVEEGLPTAVREGIWAGETAFLSRDGRVIPASQVIVAHKGPDGNVRTFSTIARDITERKRAEEEVRRLNEELEMRVIERTAQLEAANKELEAFSYSVAHNLRAPLRVIDGFSQALLEDLDEKLGTDGRDHLRRVRMASQKMGQLIDDLLNLAHVMRADMRREDVNLSALAKSIAADLEKTQPGRGVEFAIEEGLKAYGDPRLLRVVLDNLIGNAWKFTGRTQKALIEFGSAGSEGAKTIYFVRDNGAGFDMRYADKLFGAFQRLHSNMEFPGTGIGLATVHRIIKRHGGRVWGEGEAGKGATFYFTL